MAMSPELREQKKKEREALLEAETERLSKELKEKYKHLGDAEAKEFAKAKMRLSKIESHLNKKFANPKVNTTKKKIVYAYALMCEDEENKQRMLASASILKKRLNEADYAMFPEYENLLQEHARAKQAAAQQQQAPVANRQAS